LQASDKKVQKRSNSFKNWVVRVDYPALPDQADQELSGAMQGAFGSAILLCSVAEEKPFQDGSTKSRTQWQQLLAPLL